MKTKKDRGKGQGGSGKGQASHKLRKNGQSDATSTVPLEEAKKKFEAAKERLQGVKKQMRKDKNLIKTAPKKVEKLKERIDRAKAGTTRSAEDLVKKAEEFEKEATKLVPEAKQLAANAKVHSNDIGDLTIELNETKAANKKAKGTKTKEGTKGGNIKASRTALIKAINRRGWMIQYGPDGTATGAIKDKVTLTFGEDNWTSEKKGEKAESHGYGQGAVLIADELVKPPETKKEKVEGASK